MVSESINFIIAREFNFREELLGYENQMRINCGSAELSNKYEFMSSEFKKVCVSVVAAG